MKRDRHRWLATALLAAAFVLPGSAGPAAAAEAAAVYRLGPSGGPGGQPFDDGGSTRPGASVASVRVRHGSWIDAVQFVHDVNGQRRALRMHGGKGGGASEFRLAPGEFIRAIYGRFGRFVDSITIVTNRRASQRFGGPGGTVDYRYEAPPGYAIVGMVGRSGIYLDSVGVVLARRDGR